MEKWLGLDKPCGQPSLGPEKPQTQASLAMAKSQSSVKHTDSLRPSVKHTDSASAKTQPSVILLKFIVAEVGLKGADGLFVDSAIPPFPLRLYISTYLQVLRSDVSLLQQTHYVQHNCHVMDLQQTPDTHKTVCIVPSKAIHPYVEAVQNINTSLKPGHFTSYWSPTLSYQTPISR